MYLTYFCINKTVNLSTCVLYKLVQLLFDSDFPNLKEFNVQPTKFTLQCFVIDSVLILKSQNKDCCFGGKPKRIDLSAVIMRSKIRISRIRFYKFDSLQQLHFSRRKLTWLTKLKDCLLLFVKTSHLYDCISTYVQLPVIHNTFYR